jgi:hypothetical protein
MTDTVAHSLSNTIAGEGDVSCYILGVKILLGAIWTKVNGTTEKAAKGGAS